MTRVAISGYFGFGNAGDEAVLYATLRGLREFYPQVEPLVLSANPGQTAAAYGVEAAPRWPPRELGRALRRADFLLQGGGSLLQDATSLSSLLYYLGVLRLAAWLGKPAAVYAQGIGPLRRDISRRLVRRVLNRVDLIMVRDAASAALLEEIGVTRPAEVHADPALLLTPAEANLPAGQTTLLVNGIYPHRGPVCGFAVRPWDKWEDLAADLVEVMVSLKQQGWQLVLLNLQPATDRAAASNLTRRLGFAVPLVTVASVPEWLGIMANLHLLVGMRLHALILAAVMGVPLVGLAYDPKVTAFLDAVAQPGVPEEHWGRGLVARQVEAVLATREEGRTGELTSQVDPLREQARAGILRLGETWPQLFGVNPV